MTRTAKKKAAVTLNAARDIALDKLVLSQANVRRIKAGVSIEELAEDIARRGLLQGLSVRPVLDEAGVETGMYEVPAGGRRFRALQLLVKQRRLTKNALIPCIVRESGMAEEDSLAENVQRVALHPLDQFRAFLTLWDKGRSEEEIAATFFVSVNVVKQRLKLAAVSPKLLDAYAEDSMALEQLMAYTVTSDFARQEEVFERLQASYDRSAYTIRRLLTDGAIRASDKRAQFVGVETYAEAGGTVLRDLFESDDGGWLQDGVLLDGLVLEKLHHCVEPIASEGWKWVMVAPDFPYGHTHGLRRLHGEATPLTDEENATRNALQSEYDRLAEECEDIVEDLPDLVDARFAELETALAAFEHRPMQFDAEEIARAGAFVSIAPDGALRVERGYV
jgi:ParB family chromosome partitioning protein